MTPLKKGMSEKSTGLTNRGSLVRDLPPKYRYRSYVRIRPRGELAIPYENLGSTSIIIFNIVAFSMLIQF